MNVLAMQKILKAFVFNDNVIQIFLKYLFENTEKKQSNYM
ncbi:hypothetical protein BTHERMOSOX_1202 [Bathymodiolus thermophilus thioautotrophic gill symbiont]|uniref:Uncharacterized protein n=1 Tax=Bathymodiolus thermophilus thioautotrophic gill symbiont TaxID=2360 RepID=A0A8H8XEY5_9GAMM|nr:hypothetical protein THERMOS_1578 [Bathymodiolus thermophilus thioautotrophic gill symbiont]CAB5504441.1 hypothetical protein THERMOT_1965 [Bathymodiolus thermophilus thioautotrophic gill symbiont]SHA21789.1 hypothetical protein BTHERMOSOX_1202 [Bathymodiolus thermophilus thioautotrophic gill symbiont]